MAKKDVVRFGLSGMGSFSTVIADAVKRSNKCELVTCFDVISENARAGSQK